MKGKERCQILKQIRREIADANDISYVVEDCPHKGDCPGTCPKCEADVRYLETELDKRRRAGLAVSLVGIAAIPMMMTGCNADIINELSGSGGRLEDAVPVMNCNEPDELEGDVAIARDPEPELLEGEIAYDPSMDDNIEDIEDNGGDGISPALVFNCDRFN